MKNLKHLLTSLFTTFLICNLVLAQVPQGIPFQGVARNLNGNIIANQNVTLRFSIHDGTTNGTIVYQETKSTTTSALGLFNVNVGEGTPITGTFAGINWGSGAKFLQLEMDVTGGNTYSDLGTSQMMSVPYALQAGKSSDNNWTTNGNNINNTNSGNVGIGTNNPVNRFTVKHDGIGFSHESSNGTVRLGTYVSNSVAYIQTHSNHPLYFSTNNGLAQITLSTNGKVGIGTSSPAAKLDVAGDVKIVDGTQAAGYILTSDANGKAKWAKPAENAPANLSSTTIQLTTTNASAFIVPTGVSSLTVEANGGGGGGGGGGAIYSSYCGLCTPAAGNGGGGGGGENGSKLISVVPGDVVGVTIGSGGAGGIRSASAGSTGGSGMAGGVTTITINNVVVLTVNGGAGGIGGSQYSGGQGGAGGSGSNNAAIEKPGGAGGYGQTAISPPGSGGYGYAVTGGANPNGGDGGMGGSCFGCSGALYLGNDGANGINGSVAITHLGTGGNNGSTPFQSGSLIFAGAGGFFTENNSDLFWDNSNTRLGIGSSSPTAPLHVKSTGWTDINNESSNGTLGLWRVYDNTAPGVLQNGVGFWANNANSNLNLGTNAGTGNVYFSVNGNWSAPAMTINSSSNVGIGTTSPSQKLSVSGNICYTGSIGACSDIRYKKSIMPISNALENVLNLEGVTYYWKKEEFPDKQFNDKKQIGFIAQKLEKIYPELVITDADGYKSVDYSKIAPILVEAIKELKLQNDQLKSENVTLKSDNASFKSDIAKIKGQLGINLKASK